VIERRMPLRLDNLGDDDPEVEVKRKLMRWSGLKACRIVGALRMLMSPVVRRIRNQRNTMGA